MFMGKTGRLRYGWKILFVIGVFILLAIISELIIFLLHNIIASFNIFDANHLRGVFVYVSHIMQCVSTIGAVYLLWNAFEKEPISSIGYGRILKNKGALLRGFLYGALSITFVFLLLLLSRSIVVSNFNPNLSLLSWFVLFVFVGISEELLFRGYILTILKQNTNPFFALVVSSFLFSFFHLFNPNITVLGFINIFVAGAFFGLIYVESKNLWLPIGFHITWNYFQGCVFGFPVSGIDMKGLFTTEVKVDNILTGGSFGPEGGLFVTLVLILTYILLKDTLKRSTYE